MKVTFVNALKLELISQDKWRLENPFIFMADDGKQVSMFTVPQGFYTDLASVPRVPFAYLLAGGIGAKAAVAHDFLYHIPSVTKEYADKVFLAGLKQCGVAWFRRYPMYYAVKLFGDK